MTLHILTSGKSEKQARVDFLQRVLTANGLIVIYLLLNFAEQEDLRRLAGSFFYYLIAESKELAKYVYDKLCKRLMIQNNLHTGNIDAT